MSSNHSWDQTFWLSPLVYLKTPSIKSLLFLRPKTHAQWVSAQNQNWAVILCLSMHKLISSQFPNPRWPSFYYLITPCPLTSFYLRLFITMYICFPFQNLIYCFPVLWRNNESFDCLFDLFCSVYPCPSSTNPSSLLKRLQSTNLCSDFWMFFDASCHITWEILTFFSSIIFSEGLNHPYLRKPSLIARADKFSAVCSYYSMLLLCTFAQHISSIMKYSII